MAWGAAAEQRRREASSSQYESLIQRPDTVILSIYARPNKSCQAGRDASGTLQPGVARRGQREAVDPRTWRPIGRVAAASTVRVDAAIQAQRPLLETEARTRHKSLRPHRTLILAWAQGDRNDDVPMSLGSFLCPRCNVQCSTSAVTCQARAEQGRYGRLGGGRAGAHSLTVA